MINMKKPNLRLPVAMLLLLLGVVKLDNKQQQQQQERQSQSIWRGLTVCQARRQETVAKIKK